jgi:Raf kinase inhibitor-like YbhB/YbcL family protein
MRGTLCSALVAVTIVALALTVTAAQNPPPGGRGGNITPGAPGQPPGPGQPGQPGRGGRGGGRGGAQVMTLTTSAWPDGGAIPARYAQSGEQVSPAFSWSNVPEGIVSFVLIMHDVDAAAGGGIDDVLHWMLWNIPGTSRGLPEGLAAQSQLPDGTRQISVSGPYYRGPGAPASGPPHHYVFELFALDSTIDVQAVGQSPALTRAAVVAAMAGHVRGKAAYVGLFKRTP